MITYNFPFYDTLPLISSNYERAFPHIVVCGPKKSESYNVTVVDHVRGYYGYECLGKAIRQHPGFRGYFYVNDDMIVNWWNFMNFDKDKIWLGAPINLEGCHRVGQRPLAKDWIWWEATNGAEHCEKTHDEIKVLANHDKTLRVNIKKMLSNLLLNGKNKTLCFKTWSDMFYVPGRLSFEFQLFSEMFFRNKVFLEISVPTILSFLDLHENWEKAYGTYLPDIFGWVDFIKGEHPWRVYSFNKTLFIHPVKFHPTEAGTNRRNLEKVVIPYGRKFCSVSRKQF